MTESLIFAATIIVVTAMICHAAGRAWRDWLALKRFERTPPRAPANEPHVGVRIELAGVRERLRQLEDIASGVEL